MGRIKSNEFSGFSASVLQSTFSTTFDKNCGSGEGLGATTCRRTMVGVGKCMLPVE